MTISGKFFALLIGAPGSGKGTVANRILFNFNVRYFAAGDLLRNHVRNKTELGKEIGKKLKTGELLPSSLVNRIMIGELKTINDACLVDGYPRTIVQAQALEEHRVVHTVLYLNIPFSIIAERLTKRWTHLPSGRVYNLDFNPPKVKEIDDVTGERLVQRDDDKPSVVLRRLELFRKETAPVLEFYRSRGLLFEFTGETTNEIWPHVFKHLREVVPKDLHKKAFKRYQAILMDVAELMKYKPELVGAESLREKSTAQKQSTTPQAGGSSSHLSGTKKRQSRFEGSDESPASKASKESIGASVGNVEDRDRLLKLVDELPEAEPFDAVALKKLILKFEKIVTKNREMRVKHPEEPAKFLDSEIELNEVIHEMHVIATSPELFPVIIELNVITSVLQLLSHENADIAIAAVDLLQELTDVESTDNDVLDILERFVNVLTEQQLVARLVQNADRLDESVKEEAECVHQTMAIVENLVEMKPELATDIAKQGIMAWLLKRLRVKTMFDANKLYASELLSILMHNNDENRELLGSLDGVDILLQQLAAYKRHDPQSADEIEFMENLFSALCSCLMLKSNKDRFLAGEGLQLMNLMLREKKMSRVSAIKVLDYSMTGPDGADNCNKFVDILGLRSIFPLFMKPPKNSKKKDSESTESTEEHVCSIVAALLRNTTGAEQRTRLMNKFVENNHEKVERLLELHFSYSDKIKAADNLINREKALLKKRGEPIDEDMEDDFYLRRLDSGLFTLQLVDYVICEVTVNGESSIRQRVTELLNIRGDSVDSIKSVMKEYAGTIGDNLDPEQRRMEQERILNLMNKL